MDRTPNLDMPFILPSQAQKHVTHNEALSSLDALVQLSVADRDLTEPPASPAEGERHIASSGATGAWAGWDMSIAVFADGAWSRLTPRTGWLAWVADEQAFLYWDGAAWTALGTAISALQDLALLGIGTTADAANPLSAKVNNALLSARYAGEGGDGDLRIKANKEAAGGTASWIFQSGWSGRAEFGLIGDDDFALKVSADGSNWSEALRVDRETGAVAFPCGSPDFREVLTADRTYHVDASTGSDANDGLTSATAFATIQKAMDVIAADLDLGAYNVTVSIADGTYSAGLVLKSYRATSGYVIFDGNTATPANVLVSLASGQPVGNAGGAVGYFVIQGLKVETASGRGMYLVGPGMKMDFHAIDFGACSVRHLEVSHGAFAQAVGNLAISGNSTVSLWAGRKAYINLAGRTITYLNSPVFSARNWHASEQGFIDGYSMTFTNGGTVTGKRYQIAGLGGIFTNGAGATYIPGDVAGTEATGGVYY